MTRIMTVTENVWSDFNHSGICAVYKNRTGIWTGKRLVLIYHCYVQYQRLREMTIFDWYMSFIWQRGICIATCFICCGTPILLQTWCSQIDQKLMKCEMIKWIWWINSFRFYDQSQPGHALTIIPQQSWA